MSQGTKDIITISLDAMGGDNAPASEVAGAIETVRSNDGINITLVGKAGTINDELKKFSYDIWGDTVNIAARMEQSCEPGNVNISGSTYQLVKDKFTCTHRGKIEAKNKGDVDMYFVERVS